MLLKVQHAFVGTGGTTDDMYVNTTYWNTVRTSMSQSDCELLATYVRTFYTGVNGTGQSISEYYSTRCRNTLGMTKIYDNAGPPPHVPLATIGHSFFGADYLTHTPDVVSLPEEVAVCLSFRNVTAPGVPPARKRGRIYLGPLNIAAMDDVPGIDAPVRVSPEFINAIVTNAQLVLEAAFANDFEWRIYSPTNNNSYTISEWIVDDAFDTIRGRGSAPNSRVVYSG